jgi:DNA-binding LacI/PurR family transcriptional regulator
MGEESEKRTLASIRASRPFNIQQVAMRALVSKHVVTAMLNRTLPVTEAQARAVLNAINLLTNPPNPWSLENVDILIKSQCGVLHMLRATDNEHFCADQFHGVYALNEDHARELSKTFINKVSPTHPSLHITALAEGIIVGDAYFSGVQKKVEEE